MNREINEIRSRALDADLDPESLLNVPLIRQAFCDVNFKFIARGVDSNWTYEKILPVTMTGFNPFLGSFYYGYNSSFAAWLESPLSSARPLNENDLLVREVLFMVHDYLHAWAYQKIDQLYPGLQVLNGQITAANFEDYVFCHLVTEAVATVGLDYWFLSVNELNEYCPIGSNFDNLAVSYRESHLAEYRKFNPDFAVQCPEFLETLAIFYCTGEFVGFGIDDLRLSPRLLSWLQHELSYGVLQRQLIRLWLAYLAPENLELPDESLISPVQIDDEWKKILVKEISHRLWRKVQAAHSRSGTVEIDEADSWHSAGEGRTAPLEKKPDFRFVNLGLTSRAEWQRAADLGGGENFRYFAYQYLSGIPLSSVPAGHLKLVPKLLHHRNADLIESLMGDLPRLENRPEEPRDIFLPN
ncbi:MAG TPA: hypothetical protein VJ302_32350 [Blastocatellia bacterium]|nr:hypothetical protein [Blastocatellia bacterium]